METITYNELYIGLINGAREVMNNRLFLNDINVFPVADGDTGSNLFSTMHSIVHRSELKEDTKTTLEAIADSAIVGARGNSGLIFAQYFQGLSEGITDEDVITKESFTSAIKAGMEYAYRAVENPVEGTMLTTMAVFYEALTKEGASHEAFDQLLESAFEKVDQAVEHTTEQLKVLKKSAVVDSGAKGFAYFVRGLVDGIQGKVISEETVEPLETIPTISEGEHEIGKYRYCTEALIEPNSADADLKNLLSDIGDSIVQVKGKSKTRLHIHTNNPAEMFDRLSDQGKIIEQKVDDMVRQYDRIHNRKYETVIVTDSIADLPEEMLDDAQVHVVNISLLVGEETYIDKLTITNEKLFELAKNKQVHPTSSQPTTKTVEDAYRYLLSYYDNVIVFSVAKALSGTYNVFTKAAEPFNKEKETIQVIDTKQNSVAEGLIVWQAIQNLKAGKSVDDIMSDARQAISDSKILVKINTLDNMIASGRLSVRAGGIAKKVGLKPIVSLDEKGEGEVFKIAFHPEKAKKKILKHLKALNEDKGIKHYAVTYVDDIKLGNAFADELRATLGKEPEYITESSGVIAVGAGKGAVAVAYITN
ncbi:Dihydroxyacetone kinase family protein [Alkalibacterium sp. AK22]|uniref:DegV family protein n=1 Tax=Alkalibacterium sp. AK22 TaxID=1229520 RepID=UPI00044E3722|nr:DegV family protein [Alkalibacterium sp. AK22]EXJ23893.1 Dihydroxyacetone kinase family protein [Alkalibacterium sp. AK22]